MNESPFKIFGEGGKTYVYRCPGEEFNAECLTVVSVGHIYHIECLLHQNMYDQILMHHMWPSFVRLGGVNIKSYFSRTMTQNIQQSEWKNYTELVQ